MKPNLLDLFLELSEEVKVMRQRKYEQMRGYYRKHNGKETFNQSYYDQMKFEFERLERLEEFFDLLGEIPLLLVAADHLRTAKKEREQGQPIEGIRLLIPLVPVVKNPHLCYSVDLLTYEGLDNE